MTLVRLQRIALAFATTISLHGAVRRVEILERTPAPMGYERIVGRVHFGANPKLAANRIIRDLEFAPVNAAGEVEFTSDLYLFRPADPAKSNGTILFEVSNRGNKGLLGRFAYATTASEFGDQSLLEQGYTLVWLGWEWDLAASAKNLLHFTAPHFRPDTLPAPGMVRSEFVPTKTVTTMSLADRSPQTPYPVAKALGLYVLSSADSSPKQLPATQWKLSDDGTALEVPSGLEPGNLYEFVYEAKDPIVVGTGLAAIRDWISFLKYGGADTELNNESRHIKRAIGFGVSQSGRFLRTFLYDGFNADEKGRIVFDGVWADVAGAGRGSFNYRYAQPSRDGHPWRNVFYPTDVFPFTDTELLERARASRTIPKVFLTNNAYEYWGRAAALTHITADGKADAALLPDTRIYFHAGVTHGPGSLPMNTNARYMSNPLDQRPVHRALLSALQAWLKDGVAPPASVYPRISAGELTPIKGLKFPPIEGVNVPARPRLARRLDFGPDFEKKGIITQEPPVVKGAFPALLPQVDADGNDLGGIRLPEMAVPLATIAGWNMRPSGTGGPEEIQEMTGSTFPFAATKEDRTRAHDKRPSIAERYSGREDYIKRIGEATDQLIAKRLILAGDRTLVIERAGKLWDALVH
jgi:hypothetical protein